MNDMMNPRRCGDRNGRRNEGEKSENSFFEGEGSSLFAELKEWEGDGVADDNYEEALVLFFLGAKILDKLEMAASSIQAIQRIKLHSSPYEHHNHTILTTFPTYYSHKPLNHQPQ
ncbi:hypothetical protein Tco_0100289 [Tanacetum coccineum]